MALTPGTRLGVYEVTAQIGEGGMGQVYQARDTKLHRDVALKILPDAFARDPDRLARFTREAQTLASLNHPNIAQIHGFEESGNVRALVMELVEGEDLSQRIARGAIPITEALSTAKQIAEALEAAHEQGVIHRDLKPANIKVREDGTVKVLDFGLAKAMEPTGARSSNVSQSPTITTPAMTQAGMILGTAAYMSPEQARGLAVDKRTDVWAFGCVLYEMLTGRPAFPGTTAHDVLARVIEREPEWSRLPVGLPPRLLEILRQCLEKDPKSRRRDIGDVRLEIDRAQAASAQPGRLAESAPRRAPRLAWVAAAGALAAVSVASVLYVTRRPAPPETRLDVSTPEMRDPTSFAISPDGRQLAFAAIRDGRPQLHLRSLDMDSAKPLPGTEGAAWPFWSPDGRSIGFAADNHLKRIDLEGGLVQELTTVGNFQGGTWAPDGQILFSGRVTGALYRIPASGGEAVAVGALRAGEASRRMPLFLPGGRQFLFFATGTPDVRGVTLGSLDSADVTRLTEADQSGSYLSTSSTRGWVFFVRQGALVARRLDLARQQLEGEPVTVTESVAVGLLNGGVSVSATGVIAYRTGASSPRQLTWFDRSGRALGPLGEPDRTGQINVELSRDGRRVAIHRSVPGAEGTWIIDGARASRFSEVRSNASWPLWSPDGTRIAYPREGALYQRAATQSDTGSEERIGKGSNVLVDWSRDGRWVMYMVGNDRTLQDLWVNPTGGDQKPFPYLATAANELWGRFSPDSRWVAYHSNESGTGRYEVYVRRFPGPGPAIPVSTAGGIHARWAADNREMYFVAPGGVLMAAPITPRGATLEVGAPVALFQTAIASGGNVLPGIRHQYDVAPDGRFLINVASDASPVPITLIQNWKDR